MNTYYNEIQIILSKTKNNWNKEKVGFAIYKQPPKKYLKIKKCKLSASHSTNSPKYVLVARLN